MAFVLRFVLKINIMYRFSWLIISIPNYFIMFVSLEY